MSTIWDVLKETASVLIVGITAKIVYLNLRDCDVAIFFL